MATYFMLVQTAIFVFTGSQVFRVYQVLSRSETGKAEGSTTSSHGKIGMLGMKFNFFPAQGDAGGLGVPF